jgi:UDP-N-acetyl-D-mannosaminuronate dehydrogenase
MVKALHTTSRQQSADAFVTAVPTPFSAADQLPNRGYIEPAAHGISPDPSFGNIDFTGGATERLAGRLARRRTAISEFDDLPALRPSWPQISDNSSTSPLPTIVAQIRTCAEGFKRLVFSCVGLPHKPDADYLWQSPVNRDHRALGCTREQQIVIADPNLSAFADPLMALPNVSFCDALEAVRQVDIVALLVFRFPKSREEAMRLVVINVTGLTCG